jgi:hypothetical protein
VGRLWFAATALVVLVGIVLQLRATASLSSGFFDTDQARVLSVFAYFTIQSNIIVGVTSALLAVRVSRKPHWFWVLRLDGVLCITVTFVVFRLALQDLQDLEGVARTADFLLHTLSPVMCVVGWLVLGPRAKTSWDVVRHSAVFPLLWLVFALTLQLTDGFSLYPFLDVAENGWPRVLLNAAVVAVFFLGLAAAAHLVDDRLPSSRRRGARGRLSRR